MFSFQGASSSKSNPQFPFWNVPFQNSTVSLFLLSNQNPLTLGFWFVLKFNAWVSLSRDSMKHHFHGVSVNLLVESTGIEPVTSCLQGRRSPSWANPPCRRNKTHIFRFKTYISKLHCVFVSSLQIRPASPGFDLVPWELKWWAKMDSNHRPHDYQSCALASWAIGPYLASTQLFRYIFTVPSKLNNVKTLNTLYWP